MSDPGWLPIAIVLVIYLWQTWEYIARGESGLALVFFSYALGNAGFIWDFVRRIPS